MVAGSGSQALIQALPRITPPSDVAILGPTYGEHARAWTASGHRVREVLDLDDAAQADVVVVVNPNNPDGRIVAPDMLVNLAHHLAARGGLLVVDEAFGDERPELSLTSRLCPGLVVLRSFGKFFGLAGLRLGFAVAETGMAARLGDHLGPWPVSGPALVIGTQALADEAWTKTTIIRLHEAASRLDQILGAAGLDILGGTSLFRLARHDQAAGIYERLGRAGILVRAFAHRPDILRFGLPGSGTEEQRLSTALSG
ncbi:L-threonine 3-O-phosphate decarboxylase [Paramagnetospirillum magnetotacticum MS-1]|uniref:Aminotransferase n=1 Tax=Paramagnetospirillum magnetotacticum MS-1 TaxID=272627 RepID=A0A0C2YQ06_PARME|nr:L-threonine 3-O-phosphate decarboxylase [Paramagnetospirillum magnetotacticum MS-1]